MAGERPSDAEREAPRTDLPPTREPSADDGSGTGEEGAVRERDAGEREDAGEEREERPRDRKAAEEAAGGDRGIL